MEDLQGTIEVVVFPKTYEQTMGVWRDGAILLVAGRVDHRGEEASLLADSVWDWDQVAEAGPDAFAKEVGALDKRSRRGPGGNGGSGGYGNGGNGQARRDPVPVGPGAGSPMRQQDPVPQARSTTVSPVRPDARYGGAPGSGTAPAALPRVAPAEPVPTYQESPGISGASGADEPDEPALPDELRALAAAAAQAPSRPMEAAAGAVLNVRFAREAGTERVVSAMQAFKSVMRERPGATRVVVHVPAPGGTALPMELRGVAYDSELEAEVRRLIGDGVIDLSLG